MLSVLYRQFYRLYWHVTPPFQEQTVIAMFIIQDYLRICQLIQFTAIMTCARAIMTAKLEEAKLIERKRNVGDSGVKSNTGQLKQWA